MSQTQPIDAVKRSIESFLPTAYMVGIVLVYSASATVTAFLLYPAFFKIIGLKVAAIIACTLLCISLQFMRFLIVFTDSLTFGKNDSKGIVWLLSTAMLILSVFEVCYGVQSVNGHVVLSISCSSVMLAGCVLELLFVKKLNRRDLEIEANQGKVSSSALSATSNNYAKNGLAV